VRRPRASSLNNYAYASVKKPTPATIQTLAWNQLIGQKSQLLWLQRMIEELRTKTWHYQPLPKQFGDSGPGQVHWICQHWNRDVSSCRPYCQPLFPRGQGIKRVNREYQSDTFISHSIFTGFPSAYRPEIPSWTLARSSWSNDCVGYNWKVTKLPLPGRIPVLENWIF